MKKLLMNVIWGLIINAGVQSVVIVVVKKLGDAGLRIGQVGKNGPLAEFEHLCFAARPQAFVLCVVVVLAAAALRAQGPVLAEPGAVDVAAVLAAAIGIHDQARGGGLGKQVPLQNRGDECFGHGGPHVPADHLPGALLLKRA